MPYFLHKEGCRGSGAFLRSSVAQDQFEVRLLIQFSCFISTIGELCRETLQWITEQEGTIHWEISLHESPIGADETVLPSILAAAERQRIWSES